MCAPLRIPDLPTKADTLWSRPLLNIPAYDPTWNKPISITRFLKGTMNAGSALVGCNKPVLIAVEGRSALHLMQPPCGEIPIAPYVLNPKR